MGNAKPRFSWGFFRNRLKPTTQFPWFGRRSPSTPVGCAFEELLDPRARIPAPTIRAKSPKTPPGPPTLAPRHITPSLCEFLRQRWRAMMEIVDLKTDFRGSTSFGDERVKGIRFSDAPTGPQVPTGSPHNKSWINEIEFSDNAVSGFVHVGKVRARTYSVNRGHCRTLRSGLLPHRRPSRRAMGSFPCESGIRDRGSGSGDRA